MFKSSNGNYDIQKKHITGKGEWVITAGLTNNGILGRTEVPATIFKANTITVDMFGFAFYRQFPYKLVTHARVFSLEPKFKISMLQGLFFANALTYLRTLFGYNNMCSWDKIKAKSVSLPQTALGDIDFAFMDKFMRELEESRLRELEAYLLATGLNDYELTDNNHNVLNRFKKIHWTEFCIGDLFERVETTKIPYNAKGLPQHPTSKNTLPCLTSSFMNQGLNYYVPREGATILNNVISIPSNSDVYRAYYQPDDFTVLSDAYAIRWKDKSVSIMPNQYLFMVACINKVTNLPIYSYKNKLGGWNVVKNKHIVLPVNDNNQPDLGVMGQLITAMQKVTIADVARFTAQRLDATRQIIEGDSIDFSFKSANKKDNINNVFNTTALYDEYREGRIPLYSLHVACGEHKDGVLPEEEGWVDASGNGFTPDPKRHFAIHAKGDSMQPKIQDGDICVFEWYRAGSREGEIVLNQIREHDPVFEGPYTIKKYHSVKKQYEDGSWEHEKIQLIPLNKDYDVIELDSENSYRTIGIFKCVLKS